VIQTCLSPDPLFKYNIDKIRRSSSLNPSLSLILRWIDGGGGRALLAQIDADIATRGTATRGAGVYTGAALVVELK